MSPSFQIESEERVILAQPANRKKLLGEILEREGRGTDTKRKDGRSRRKRFDLNGRIARRRIKILVAVLIYRMGIRRRGAHPVTDEAGVLSGVAALVVMIMIERVFLDPDHHQAGQREINQRNEEGGSFGGS